MTGQDLAVGALALALAGCVAAAEPPTRPPLAGPGAPQPGRTVCGWEQVDEGTPRLTVGADGDVTQPTPAGPIVVLSVDPMAPFGSVRQALEPLEESLVRVKVVIDGRWLLPLTYPYRRPTSLPKPDQPAVRTVGHRRITRSVGAPADRFADLRLTGDQAQIFVEHGGPSATLPVGELAKRLRQTKPAVGTFALRVTDETAFEHVATVLVAAACYDREPGAEAHEVILD